MWLPLWDCWLLILQTLSQRCTSPSGCRLWDVRYSLDVIRNKKSSCLCLFSRWWVGVTLVVVDDDEDEEEEEKLFFCCCCFLAAFTLADSTAWVRLGLVESLLLICSPVNHTSCSGWVGQCDRTGQSKHLVHVAYICSTCCDAAYIWSTCSQAAYLAYALNWCSTCQRDRRAGSVPAI